MPMPRIVVKDNEVRSIKGLLNELAERYRNAEDPEFLRDSSVAAHRLPERLRRALVEFRNLEPDDAVCIISGYPIENEKIGPTPQHWKHKPERPTTVEEEMLLVLFASLLGDCIGWATQQDGRIVHDILPIREHEGDQLGSGSKQVLCWHTEDAFHPFRGDYVGMMCLRNPDHVPTTLGALSRVQVNERQRKVLAEPHYTIKPDESHKMKNRGVNKDIDEHLLEAYGRIEESEKKTQKIPVMFGSSEAPYFRLDPYFMDRLENQEAQEALDEFVQQVDSIMEDLVLEPGDFCFIDNFKAVHGRKPFTARYDGQDRWMKRVNVTRDLRKSRESRVSADSRVIF